MSKGLLPHNIHLGELGLLSLSMGHEIPHVQSFLDSYLSEGRKESHAARGWMFCTDGKSAENNSIEPLFSLHNSVKEFGLHLKVLIDHIEDFKMYPRIFDKIHEIKKLYFKMPFMEAELHLIRAGHTLDNQEDFLADLSKYMDHVVELHSVTTDMRGMLMQEVIDHMALTHSFPKKKQKDKKK